MEAQATQRADYALGHSEQELERLNRQGNAFAPFTRHVFEEAGITAGMRVLDVGCGGGDVALLAAEMVGLSGQVVAVDREAAAVEWAISRCRSRRVGNIEFVCGDPAEMTFDEPFDAVVGRLVLMYYRDPVETVRKLARHLSPGGVVAFQEFDIWSCRSVPNAPTFERAVGWIRQTLQATGARLQLGPELYSVYIHAGLPAPKMRMDALVGGGPDYAAYEMVPGVIRTLVPVMEKLGIATSDEVDVGTLAQRMRDEVVAMNGVVLSPALIGAWTRKG